MANTIRELAAELSIAACQVLEFQKTAKALPHVNIVSIALADHYDFEDDAKPPTVTCHITRAYYNRKGEYIDLGLDGQIDAVRTWAHELGADLQLGDERIHRHTPTRATRALTTETVLPNGLHVRIYACLDYPAETDRPAPKAAAVTT